MPNEKFKAIESTRDFLERLLCPEATPRVPRSIRQEALWRLRHFPTKLDMENSRLLAPKVWGEKDDA